MSEFSGIDLARLPAPVIIDRSDFETIFAELKADLVAAMPDLSPVLELESEPLVKVLEVWAYRELLLRGAVDDAGRGNLLAFATGSNLDHLAAFYGVVRQVVTAADPSQIPPVAEVLEADDRLRYRVQLALEGFSTAGPSGAYVFWSLAASPNVKDVSVSSPTPGEVVVAVLSTEGDGVPDAALLDAVEASLMDEDRRPLTDLVVVNPAVVTPYAVEAVLTLYPGPDGAAVLAAAEAAVAEFVEGNHRLGHDIAIAGIHAALFQPGVQNLELISPAADIIMGSGGAAFCSGVTLTIGGRDV